VARLRLLLALAALSLALGACGGDDGDSDDEPVATAPPAETTATEASSPLEFTGPALEDQDRSAEATVRVQTAELSSTDGATALLRFEDGGPPQNYTGSGECDGATFDQAAVVDTPATGTVEIEGVGTADLAVEQTVTAFAGAPPPPCEERTGTWTGTSGELGASSGSFTAVTTLGASVAETRLTLQEE
jgi:hypothetical protein